MARTPVLQPETPIEKVFRITTPQKKALDELGLATVRDLLFHFPSRYESAATVHKIRELAAGADATVYGHIAGMRTAKAFRKKIPMTKAKVADHTGTIEVVWFHQPYIEKLIDPERPVELRGRVGKKKSGGLFMANPKIKNVAAVPRATIIPAAPDDAGGPAPAMVPVYPESRGISSRWFYYAMRKLFLEGIHERVPDPLPQELLKKYNLPTQKAALVWIHEPRNESDSAAARKRFAFEEVFFVQLERMRRRHAYRENDAFEIDVDHARMDDFKDRFPFALTQSQEEAIRAITEDFRKREPMARLLEGDVGSGKTIVAAATSFAVVTSRPKGQTFGNLQAAVMTPTEILAHQHFESFITLFSHLPIGIGLITGSGCKKFPSKVNPQVPTAISRSQLLKWVANGEIPILVGTHALIQKTVKFKHLAYVVIDEQHRFGTMQRFKLLKKDGVVPHLLSMTATPIPRTLALTVHGDLDLTLLSDMPPGRKDIKTYLVFPHEREYAYEEVKKELRAGRQAYVICPRIDEPDPAKRQALYAKSVIEEAARLKKEVFSGFTVGMLHGKMAPRDKETVMEHFKNKLIDVLVATSVVEVGVNVPNATVIMIEGAERFGLAQLHQLRGRVLRSARQAHCYIFSESKTKQAIARLKALKNAKNGFELAETDLAMRGAGELYGRKQWGISDIGMEAIKNIKMVEAARAEARAMLEADAMLEKQPLIAERVNALSAKMHFE